jgi:hypothetical protein
MPKCQGMFEGGRPPSRVIAEQSDRRIVDFGAPLAHTVILLPLGGRHILSPKPPDDPLDNCRISKTLS